MIEPGKSKRVRKPGSKNKSKLTNTTTTNPPRRGRPPKAEKGKDLASDQTEYNFTFLYVFLYTKYVCDNTI